jgi:hypothetical protein
VTRDRDLFLLRVFFGVLGLLALAAILAVVSA